MSQETANMIISYGSSIFLGALIIMNLRGFTATMLKFTRLLFKSFLSSFISSDFLLLLLTELLGVRHLV